MRASYRAALFFDGEHWFSRCRIHIDRNGRVVEIEKRATQLAGERDVALIMPGLVNAHCHLELGHLELGHLELGHQELAQPGAVDFPAWLRQVASRRAGPKRAREIARHNLERAIASGTTTFADIDSEGGARAVLETSRVKARSYAEVLGFDVKREEALSRVNERLVLPKARITTGLSPHAPYSVSAALFRAAERTGQRLAVHTAESEEEQLFCMEGTGPFRALLEDFGRWDRDFEAPGCSALAYLDRMGLLSERCLVVHARVLVDGDLELLARSGTPVVVCPGSDRYFGRSTADVSAMLDQGINVCLGTDSLASNEDLDMFREMALLRESWPSLEPELVLRMAGTMAARAIGMPGSGRLRPGDEFDAVLLDELPARDQASAAEYLSSGIPSVREIIIAGRAFKDGGLADYDV